MCICIREFSLRKETVYEKNYIHADSINYDFFLLVCYGFSG